MRREYNHNISERANRSLAKRAAIVSLQKKLIAITILIVVSVIVLLASSISAMASAKNNSKPVYKYYTSIEVQDGDTLWSIADSYIDGYNIDRDDYMDEICELNHLDLDGSSIHSGEYLTIAYYSNELK